MFDLLKNIKDDESWFLNVLLNAKGDANRQKVIDFIESGKTDEQEILLFSLAVKQEKA